MKLRFLAGLAAGYVMGTRDGRERYEQIVQAVTGSSLFQQARGELFGGASDRASDATPAAERATELARPPVIVGPGPAGMTTLGSSAVVLPDLETSSTPSDGSEGQQAKRLRPPADG